MKKSDTTPCRSRAGVPNDLRGSWQCTSDEGAFPLGRAEFAIRAYCGNGVFANTQDLLAALWTPLGICAITPRMNSLRTLLSKQAVFSRHPLWVIHFAGDLLSMTFVKPHCKLY